MASFFFLVCLMFLYHFYLRWRDERNEKLERIKNRQKKYNNNICKLNVMVEEPE